MPSAVTIANLAPVASLMEVRVFISGIPRVMWKDLAIDGFADVFEELK